MADIKTIISDQKTFFESGRTREVNFRIRQLRLLHHAVEQHETEILDALYKDLRKPHFEGYLTEVGIIRDDIRHTIKKVGKWARTKTVKTPIYHWPAKSMLYPEPYGRALIIAPWNYPAQLALVPLTAAMAAGNCAVVKPSEIAPHTAEVLAEMIPKYFDPGYISVVTGDAGVSKALLSEKFDVILFTGSTAIGREVMRAAAEHLTPVILELGGKSPAIVAKDADLNLAAKKIASGKFINAGQTCIAPDYVMVSRGQKQDLMDKIKAHIVAFYGQNPKESPDYPRIVSEKHFDRLAALMADARIDFGGDTDRESLYMAPTLLDDVNWEHPVMQEEIFGPVLPVLTYESMDEVIGSVGSRPRPLALYLFTRNERTEQQVMENLSFGGGCINDTLIHVANPNLPFGGVGDSGIGRYHGKAGFDAFSNERGIMKSRPPFDNPFRYPPFMKSLSLIKKVLH